MTFEENIKMAKEIFTSDEWQERIGEWETKHKKSKLWVNLSQHAAMKELIELLRENLINIDIQLGEQNVKGQEDIIERLSLKNKKELYIWFLNLFSEAKDRIISTEKEVEEDIEVNG